MILNQNNLLKNHLLQLKIEIYKLLLLHSKRLYPNYKNTNLHFFLVSEIKLIKILWSKNRNHPINIKIPIQSMSFDVHTLTQSLTRN